MDIILFTCFTIFQTACILIPIINKERLPNGQRSEFNRWDKALIIFTIVAFGFSLWIFLSNKDDEDNYKANLKSSLAERDSLHRVQDSTLIAFYSDKVDSSYSKSIKASNEALAKYNLELIDSMKKVTSSFPFDTSGRPIVLVRPNSKNESNLYLCDNYGAPALCIKFISENRAAFDLSIESWFFKIVDRVGDKGSLDTLDKDKFIKKVLTPSVITTLPFLLKPQVEKCDDGLILLRMKYGKNENSKIKYSSYYYCEYDFKNGKKGKEFDFADIKHFVEFANQQGYLDKNFFK